MGDELGRHRNLSRSISIIVGINSEHICAFGKSATLTFHKVRNVASFTAWTAGTWKNAFTLRVAFFEVNTSSHEVSQLVVHVKKSSQAFRYCDYHHSQAKFDPEPKGMNEHLPFTT